MTHFTFDGHLYKITAEPTNSGSLYTITDNLDQHVTTVQVDAMMEMISVESGETVHLNDYDSPIDGVIDMAQSVITGTY